MAVNPLTIEYNSESDAPAVFGGIYVPSGETDVVGSGNVTANFLATGSASLSNGQLGLGS